MEVLMVYGEANALFGKKVNEERQSRGITREKLSEIVGISVVYCRDIEIGKSRPNWMIWAKICLVLQIDMLSIASEYLSLELNESGEIYGMVF